MSPAATVAVEGDEELSAAAAAAAEVDAAAEAARTSVAVAVGDGGVLATSWTVVAVGSIVAPAASGSAEGGGMEELPAAGAVADLDLWAAESAVDAEAPTAAADEVALTLENEMETFVGSHRWQLGMITGKTAAVRFSSTLAFMTASPHSSWQATAAHHGSVVTAVVTA